MPSISGQKILPHEIIVFPMQATCPAIIKKPAAANHIRDRTWSTIRGRRRARRLQAPARPETIYSDDWRSI